MSMTHKEIDILGYEKECTTGFEYRNKVIFFYYYYFHSDSIYPLGWM